VIFDLRSDLYSHMGMLPLRWFDNRATGDLMTRRDLRFGISPRPVAG
jgi:ABC-type multidrug transport system fused ATPase/permease subunit